ncbi:GntR family transcriptional regulator [Actibacterium pelagium]|uniref:GntR family transcriptional regulator n=1 Tax=Actibacterium pelagium TaxID=2029103 RepID=A0A917EIM5_9RHOB|nr:GntR family transcriptional regulator [Actibacterium pelagium]GGE45616.1 GntR family transcriptional regulator [Actibacterium pelagium]
MTISARTIGQGRATLAGEVRGEIERMIVEGDLAAGEKLNELALSNVMGVSRGTVREAIRSLADSGLIDLIANRGAFVHETTLGEVRNLYELRAAIFGLACASSARRVRESTEPNLPNALTKNIAKMEKAHKSGETAAYYKLNIEFHDLLLHGAGNPRAKAMYDNLVKEMHLFRRRGLSVPHNIARSLEEHSAISDAVISGDAEAARKAAEHHIAASLTRYMKMVEKEDVGST